MTSGWAVAYYTTASLNIVPIKTVTYKQPSIPPAPSQSSDRPPTLPASVSAPASPPKSAAFPARSSKPSPLVQPPSTEEHRPFKPPINKKDLVAALFMSKHAPFPEFAYSAH
ncbi:hypothetical protein C8R48DRAFT_774557 [Suillus tomentosus]|nr:hypothetical protein C8R48DRAFT_774557 [Suillus tomentosus]